MIAGIQADWTVGEPASYLKKIPLDWHEDDTEGFYTYVRQVVDALLRKGIKANPVTCSTWHVVRHAHQDGVAVDQVVEQIAAWASEGLQPQ